MIAASSNCTCAGRVVIVHCPRRLPVGTAPTQSRRYRRIAHAASGETARDDSARSTSTSPTQPHAIDEPAVSGAQAAQALQEHAAQPTSSSPPLATPGPLHNWLLTFLPPALAGRLITTATVLLKANLWAVLLVYVLKDSAAFVLHRASQRITNLLSDNLLGTSIGASVNPWWLHLDSAFLELHPGYQALIVLLFLAALPLNILLSTSAAIAAARLCVTDATRGDILAAAAAAAAVPARKKPSTPKPSSPTLEDVAAPKKTQEGDLLTLATSSSVTGTTEAGGQGPTTSTDSSRGAEAPTAGQSGNGNGTPSTASGTSLPPEATPNGPVAAVVSAGGGAVATVRRALSDVRGVIPDVAASVRRIWWVDCLFNLRALPLQALSLLVIPLPWTVPRLLAVQLAVPAAIFEGLKGRAALDRSAKLMAAGPEVMAAYGWPFLALIIAVRVLDGVRNVALALIPTRWWQDVVEVPLLVTALFAFAKMLVIRLQDLLPLAAYLVAQRREAGEAEGSGPLVLPTLPTSVPTI